MPHEPQIIQQSRDMRPVPALIGERGVFEPIGQDPRLLHRRQIEVPRQPRQPLNLGPLLRRIQQRPSRLWVIYTIKIFKK